MTEQATQADTAPAAAQTTPQPEVTPAAALSDASTPSSIYRPEGLPEHLLGKDDKETIDKLHKAHSGARKAIGELGELPATAEGYKFEAQGRVAQFGDLSADPLLKGLGEIAHKNGLRPAQLNGFMNGFIEQLIDQGVMASKEQVEAQRAAIIPEGARHLTQQEQEVHRDRRIQENKDFLGVMQERGMPEAAAKTLAQLLETAEGNMAVEFFAKQAQGVQPALGGSGGSAISQNTLNERNRDPRSDRDSEKYDPNFVKDTEKMYQQLYS